MGAPGDRSRDIETIAVQSSPPLVVRPLATRFNHAGWVSVVEIFRIVRSLLHGLKRSVLARIYPLHLGRKKIKKRLVQKHVLKQL